MVSAPNSVRESSACAWARRWAGYTIPSIVNQLGNRGAGASPSKPETGWQFAAFREWRARHHPRAAYQMAPRVWRPERLEQFASYPEAERRMLKGGEPRLTAMAYSDRNVFLVEVGRDLSPEHVGRLLFLVDLFRRDPDYSEHHDKRLRMVMLVREATALMIDFARRRRIRIAVLDGPGDQRRANEVRASN